MRHCLILTTTCLLALTHLGRAEPKEPKGGPPPAKFKGTAQLLKTLQLTTNFSPDKRAATVSFRGAGLQADVGGKHSPDVSTQSASIRFDLAEKKKAAPLHLDARGFVRIDSGARAMLIVRAAGDSKVVNLADIKLENGTGKDRGKQNQNGEHKEGDFTISMDLTLPEKRSLHVTFFLLVERDGDDPEVGARIQMDSLDLEIMKAVPEKKKPKK